MGAKTSKVSADDDHFEGSYGGSKSIWDLHTYFDKETSIPAAIQVAHYTPSGFPLTPIVTKKTQELTTKSWSKIVNKKGDDGSSGITSFYTEFYDRLDALDSSGKFEAVLSAHTSGVNKIAAKGEILIRIIKFALNIEGDSKSVQFQLYLLGKSHCQKKIRPWQYSVFVQALLYTIASRLGTDATHDVMTAWTNLFAFILKSMLPQAIKGTVIESEICVNTSSEFLNGDVAAQVEEIEETKALAKKNGRSSDGKSDSGISSNTIGRVPESTKDV